MSTRPAARLAVIATGIIAPVFAAANPVFATVKVSGQHYSSLGLTNTIVLFVVTPLAIFGVVALLAALPSTLAMRRQPEAIRWNGTPMWIGVPDSVRHSIEIAVEQRPAIGTPAHTPVWLNPLTHQPDLVSAGSTQSTARGGASAEW